MHNKLSLLLLATLAVLANGASIAKPEDSYQPRVSEEDIRENLIHDEEVGDIEGLLPPLPQAKDYFNTPVQKVRESSYVLDKVNNTVKLVGEAKSEVEELSEDERQAMKDVAAAIEKLLIDAQSDGNPHKIQPVVIISDDGVAVQISPENKNKTVSKEENSSEVEVTTYPYGETETFTTDVLPNDEPRSDSEEPAKGLFSHIWDIVVGSVTLAADMLRSLTHSDAPVTESPIASSTPKESTSTSSAAPPVASLAALEESESKHRLPSQEFEKGGRDIDSLLYGRGIA